VLTRINQQMFPFVALGLIVVIGTGSHRAEAARVHLIAVGDTLDKDIGKFVREDLGSLISTFEHIGKKSLLKPVILEDAYCNPTAIHESLNSLKIQPDDAVIFYFTGHGAYDQGNGQFLQIPRLGKDGDVSRDQLRDKIKGWVDARQIRLGVIMTDMCNLQKIIAMPNEIGTGAKQGENKELIEDLPLFRSLFVDSEGFVDVSSASPNEAAATYPKLRFTDGKEMADGSIYSTVFSKLLENQSNDSLSWNTFLREKLAMSVQSDFINFYPNGIDLPDGVNTQKKQTVMIKSIATLKPGSKVIGDDRLVDIPRDVDVIEANRQSVINQVLKDGIRIDSIGVTVSRKIFPRNINGKLLYGVRIIYIDDNAPVNASWEAGDVIYSINSVEVGNIQRFKQLVANPGNSPFGAWWKASIQKMVRRQPIVLRGNGRANGPVNGRIRLGVVPEVQIRTVQTDKGPQNGVQIASVVPGTPADNRMVDPGDIVLSINGMPTPTLEEFYEAISKADGVIEIWGFNSATGHVENFRPIPLK
jgi:hypothetical protein